MTRLVRRRADELDALLLTALDEWIRAQRWFPLKGASGVETTISDALHLDDELLAAGTVRVLFVRTRRELTEHVLQVPVALAGRDETVDPAKVVATVPLDGGRAVLDGAAHPRFVAALLATAERTDDAPLDIDPSTARAISGEQSNTSVLLSPAPGGAPTAILKILRTLAPGDNPDVDVPRRLAALGWSHVPVPRAWLEGSWRAGGPGRPPQDEHGHLAVLADFVTGAADGFELACRIAGDQAPFAELAHDLGATVAGLHTALRAAYPEAVTPTAPADVATAIANRFAWATAAVPRLADLTPGVEATLDRVRALPAVPARQRVHGDLHLGQVLRGDDRWYVLDFEGEPAAPLEQRTRPDLALRDVAGVLRSLDYAAAVGGLTGADASRWTATARQALLDGYLQAATHDAPPATTELLLAALELDKALYEAVYEARNRPDWLPIPLAGLDRLLH